MQSLTSEGGGTTFSIPMSESAEGRKLNIGQCQKIARAMLNQGRVTDPKNCVEVIGVADPVFKNIVGYLSDTDLDLVFLILKMS